LPHLLGESPALGRFFDQFNDEPEALWAMHIGAERLLLEPAQTATLIKFAILLDGLSIPLIERIWPQPKTDLAPTATVAPATGSSADETLASVRRVLAATVPATTPPAASDDAAGARRKRRAPGIPSTPAPNDRSRASRPTAALVSSAPPRSAAVRATALRELLERLPH
jgi:hypothetical protein